MFVEHDFPGYEGVLTTDCQQASTRVKREIRNRQITDSESVARKCTKCTQKKYEL